MADILPNIIDAPQRKRDKYRFRLALRAALRSATFESFLTGAIIFYALNLCTLSYLEAMPASFEMGGMSLMRLSSSSVLSVWRRL